MRIPAMSERKYRSLEAFDQLNVTYEYVGSWKNLQQIFNDAGQRGRWDDLGALKRFTPKTQSEMYYWWSDTGDIIARINADRLLPDCSRVDWRAVRPIEPVKPQKSGHSGSRWTTFSFDGLCNTSLPQLAFFYPRRFFCDESCDDYKQYGVSNAEIAEMREKLSTIRIPTCDVQEPVVVHWLVPVNLDMDYGTGSLAYTGFRIEPANRAIERGRGRLVEAHHIDFRVSVDPIGRDGGARPFSSLIQAIAPNDTKPWTRQRCEQFFDDDRNFIPLTELRARFRNEARSR